MKFNKIIATVAIALGASLSACNYLDVVPPEQAQLPDATKSYDNSLGFLYSCYGGIYNPMTTYSAAEAASDEWVLPPTWNETMHNYLRGLVTASAVNDWRWGNHYRFIGQCYLFLQEIEKGKIDDYMSEADKEEFRRTARAEANFLIAYYHMQALIGYGPIPIMTEYIDMNADKSLYPGRSHFDYCVEWICNKFDEAAQDLPATREGTEWGRATSVIAKALKSRLLVYAASPLWNGSFYDPTWKNKVETPGYGYELVSNTYDPQKWERAKEATKEALDLAIQSGHALYNDLEWYTNENNVTLPYIPGIDASTSEGLEFQKRVMMLRYLVTTRVNQGNKEIIWGLANQGDWTAGALPHHVLV